MSCFLHFFPWDAGKSSDQRRNESPYIWCLSFVQSVQVKNSAEIFLFYFIQTLHHRVDLFRAFFLLYRFSPLYSFNLHGSDIFRVLFFFPITPHNFSFLFHSTLWNSFFFQTFSFSFTKSFFVSFLLFSFFSSIIHAFIYSIISTFPFPCFHFIIHFLYFIQTTDAELFIFGSFRLLFAKKCFSGFLLVVLLKCLQLSNFKIGQWADCK